jgi:hypothetical protein
VSDHYGYTADYEADALLIYDLSSIPSKAVIFSANLYLYYANYFDTDPVDREITCHRITSSWDANTATWNTKPTYLASETSSVLLPAYFTWVHWNVTVDVQNIVDGTNTNYGWLIRDYKDPWGGFNIPQQQYYSMESTICKPYLIVTANTPPEKPAKPSGSTLIIPGVEYSYTTTTTDPENNQVYYKWDWGDGQATDWLGPYNSGVNSTATHTWALGGTVSIKVKAKDIYGAESDWSEPLPYKIPRNTIIIQLLQWCFERFPHAFPILRQLLGY